MKTSKLGKDIIKEFESFRSTPYKCSAGKITIGWGHVILPGEKISVPITKGKGEELLSQDLEQVEKCIEKNITVPLTQQETDALSSLIFNIGISAFRGSTLRWKLNQGLRKEAAEEFLRWNKYTDPEDRKLKVAEGLDQRRKKERELFLRKD